MMNNNIYFDTIRHILTGVVFGLGALFVTWILASETSPFREYFLWNVRLPNIWRLLNVSVVMASIIAGVNSVAFSVLVIFLQWFIVGFLCSLAVTWFRRKQTIRRNG